MLLEGRSYTPQNDEERKIVTTYNNYILCKTFGWTEEELLTKNSWSFYNDCITLLSMQSKLENLHNK